MKKKKTDVLYGYYNEKVKNIKVPGIDFTRLPSFNNKRKNYGCIPKIIYACAVFLITFATLMNWDNQSHLEKQIESLDQKFEISRLIPEGLENINKIMHEYFQEGEKL